MKKRLLLTLLSMLILPSTILFSQEGDMVDSVDTQEYSNEDDSTYEVDEDDSTYEVDEDDSTYEVDEDDATYEVDEDDATYEVDEEGEDAIEDIDMTSESEDAEISEDDPTTNTSGVLTVGISKIDAQIDVYTNNILSQTLSNNSKADIGIGIANRTYRLEIAPSEQGFAYFITNMSVYNLKIVWDDMFFIDASGRSQPVNHNKILTTDRYAPQADTLIPRASKIKGLILPRDTITQNGDINPIFYKEIEYGPGKDFTTYEEAKAFADEFGKKISDKPYRISFVISMFDRKIEYVFTIVNIEYYVK